MKCLPQSAVQQQHHVLDLIQPYCIQGLIFWNQRLSAANVTLSGIVYMVQDFQGWYRSGHPKKTNNPPPVVIALATPHRSRPKTSRTLGVLHDPPNLAYPCCVVHGSTPLKCNDNDDVETNSALAERRPALVTELRLECTSETLAVVELRFRVLQAASSARQSSGWPRYPGLFGLGRPDTRRERSHVLSTSTQVPTRTDLQNG
jgi:hypothetical protein